ncbi:unnamed protein product, partial [marine sediment metagenome]
YVEVMSTWLNLMMMAIFGTLDLLLFRQPWAMNFQEW